MSTNHLLCSVLNQTGRFKNDKTLMKQSSLSNLIKSSSVDIYILYSYHGTFIRSLACLSQETISCNVYSYLNQIIKFPLKFGGHRLNKVSVHFGFGGDLVLGEGEGAGICYCFFFIGFWEFLGVKFYGLFFFFFFQLAPIGQGFLQLCLKHNVI